MSNVRTSHQIPVVMTIAGSDSGGGAGIQADLKTFASLGVFGTSAITCLTAQNPEKVAGIEPITPAMVALQINTVCRAFKIIAAKTGMLFSREIISAVAGAVRKNRISRLVVDPVMVSTSGSRLLRRDAEKVICSKLFPLAAVVTPNLDEAELLCGWKIKSLEGLKAAAVHLAGEYGTAFVVKGGHLGSGTIVYDVLCEGRKLTVFKGRRIKCVETHGTGCTFSSALTAFLAKGLDLETASRKAKLYVTKVLRSVYSTGHHTVMGW